MDIRYFEEDHFIFIDHKEELSLFCGIYIEDDKMLILPEYLNLDYIQ